VREGGRVSGSEVLVRVTRGGLVESVHAGSFALVEHGETTLSRGTLATPVYLRSSLKPFQAIEVVASGAADAFGLTPEEIALAAGSHSGEPRHLAVARSILAKAGVPEGALRCGGHRSANPDVAFAQRREGVAIGPIHSNCSGKHAAMLAAARHGGASLEGYLDPGHPVQVFIRHHFAAFAGVEPASVHVGVDGCGAPAFACPLDAVARAAWRFADLEAAPTALREPARRVLEAMLAHPEMVAGTDRFDTDLMRAAKGAVVAKAGAEGFHLCAVPSQGAGFAVKVDDGSDRGYRPVVIEMMRRLGALTDEAACALREKHAPEVVRSLAGEPVGKVEVVLE
jgi:L-asparaginase II